MKLESYQTFLGCEGLYEQLGRPEMFPKVQNDNVNVVFQYVVVIETKMFFKENHYHHLRGFKSAKKYKAT